MHHLIRLSERNNLTFAEVLDKIKRIYKHLTHIIDKSYFGDEHGFFLKKIVF